MTTSKLRDEAEKTERGRWIKMLKDLLVEADTPVTKGGGDLTRRYGKGSSGWYPEEACEDMAKGKQLDEGYIRLALAYRGLAICHVLGKQGRRTLWEVSSRKYFSRR